MPLNVFLVEDSPVIRDNFIATVEELVDARVVATADGEAQAIAWLDNNANWSLVVIDLFLVQGSGLGVLKACRTRPPHQYAVVVSNYATAEIRQRALELGADAVFDKSNELDGFLDFCTQRAKEVVS